MHRGSLFLFLLILTNSAGLCGEAAAAIIGPHSSSPKVDHRQRVSRADLEYRRPVTRSEEGLPIGNGRMGSLVWTTPTTLRFQINRVDIYPVNSGSRSFFERHSDYCCGAGFVDLDFGSAGDDVFTAEEFSQRLSVYDGLVTVRGKGVGAGVLAWHEHDVLAIRVEDRRRAPQPSQIKLRMLRYASQYLGGQLEDLVKDHVVKVQTAGHTAASRLIIEGETIFLTQEFREEEHYNKSALAIRVVGWPARPRIVNETEACLALPAGTGEFTVLIASAASFDPGEDVVQIARRSLELAAMQGFLVLAADNGRWWHDFWDRSYIQLKSDDGVADYLEENYNYFLYVMASSSRGRFPPKFNGMLWNTGGDLRAWGGQHWFANLSCYYEALPASGRMELMDPAFDMYSGMYEACAVAARQQWGSKGIFIPETVWFDGLARLPDDIAEEMRELYLLRRPWERRSARFLEFAKQNHPHSSRWNWLGGGSWVEGSWVAEERGFGPYGPVTHILGTTAKVAYLYWRRYEYTLDREWLRERAYPMLKGAAEFYRSFPHLKKGPDGRYHIHHVNSNESVWGARDTDEDLSALRGVLAAAIRASEVLEADAEMRSLWRELLDRLAPLPASDHPEALRLPDYQGPRVWVRGLSPAVRAQSAFLPDPNSLPMWFFDLCNLESEDPQALETANATFSSYYRNGIDSDTPVGVLSKLAIAAATLGRAEAVRHLIPNQMRVLRLERGSAYQGGGVLANRMTLREGPQALGVQRLGRAAEALQLALLQSSPAAPAGDPIIRVFPAWPREWEASYRLAARGAFWVSSSIREGRIRFIELESDAGAFCRLRNPWGQAQAVDLYRDGQRAERLQGDLLAFPTRPGEKVVLVPAGGLPE
jgi:hypothetical protein